MTLVERIAKECLDLSAEKAQRVLNFVETLKGGSGSEEADLEQRRGKARELLRRTRIDFGGKPMTNRDEANARR